MQAWLESEWHLPVTHGANAWTNLTLMHYCQIRLFVCWRRERIPRFSQGRRPGLHFDWDPIKWYYSSSK